ncbi:DUF1003 domain-containing protein [Brevundimonas mediterranea]|uniref:Putative membrane protein n=1 Tax=Brevundimonas mediterranea TaxID=74329 RepID=A0A7W6A5E6_9CAUL|nr:DUF1003 domain-containing protein [Brevundimonas mediterranea]MBB3873064.1 putative membrane protein [Brevundimonas mediterranea]
MTLQIRQDELSLGLLGVPYADLTPVQRSVVDLMVTEAPSGVSPILEIDDRTFWERLADTVADVGGSWTFIGVFSCVLLGWAALNLVLARFTAAFDPYPFIFLNLMLSAVAALQAPVIMMSQKRQAVRDRIAAEHDYTVNLRAELEIMRLHDRLQLSQGQMERIEAALAALARP